METRLIPTVNPDLPGDLADPWEAFLDGQLDYKDLPADLQADAVRAGLA